MSYNLKTIIASALITATLSIGSYFAYKNKPKTFINPIYSKEQIGELYGTNLSQAKEKFVFTNSQALKSFIKQYLEDNKLRQVVDLNFIDISNIKDLNFVFSGDVSGFTEEELKKEGLQDLPKIKNGDKYSVCKSTFNHKVDISRWDTSNVTDLRSTFACSSVDFGISKWNTSQVTNMQGTFMLALKFNGDISNWNTSKVTDLFSAFAGARSFAGDLSKWDVSNVEYLDYTFFMATVFNSDLSNWNVSNVKNMKFTFAIAEKFTSDLSRWNVSNVRSFLATFYGASSFYSNLSLWNTSKAYTISWMFAFTNFRTDLNFWNLSSVEYAEKTFFNSQFREFDIYNWKNKIPSLYNKLEFNKNYSEDDLYKYEANPKKR
ncbi:hypothetical protein CKF54_04090 [Psittacicella hinzii]|uniref:BspA family leucine-rich repeat surface protein n=1 Tax=Psittacicella hinzii TaxID=2028575 RepID=A0A3A1Y6G3_9GAMM|nr:BspA family leucine-rich repeat surface protein [Psittacicella hinzii]RIY32880.1 hypothetical protein CKF54_04090 [Psittacicella hinzii]